MVPEAQPAKELDLERQLEEEAQGEPQKFNMKGIGGGCPESREGCEPITALKKKSI